MLKQATNSARVLEDWLYTMIASQARPAIRVSAAPEPCLLYPRIELARIDAGRQYLAGLGAKLARLSQRNLQINTTRQGLLLIESSVAHMPVSVTTIAEPSVSTFLPSEVNTNKYLPDADIFMLIH